MPERLAEQLPIVTAFRRCADGTFEKYQLHRIDFDEAVSTRTVETSEGEKVVRGEEEWSAKLPNGATVRDKSPKRIVVERRDAVSIPAVPRSRTRKIWPGASLSEE